MKGKKHVEADKVVGISASGSFPNMSSSLAIETSFKNTT